METTAETIANKKTVTILGGTGFVGRHLSERLEQNGYQVKPYGRSAFASPQSLINAIDHADYLVVLTGENIGQRWSDAYKQALYDSRVKTNQQIQEAIQACQQAPQKILSASAIGIYPETQCDKPVDESCEEVGDNFLGELGQAWEESSRALEPTPIVMRFGVVLGKEGGALAKMLPAFKLGLGGPVAGGQQCFTWVHIDDLTRAIEFLMQQGKAGETYNICAPQPLSNKEFGATLAKTLNRPFWLPLPEWQLKLMFGEGAQVLTHSSAVIPTKIQQAGFEFSYPSASAALAQILN